MPIPHSRRELPWPLRLCAAFWLAACAALAVGCAEQGETVAVPLPVKTSPPRAEVEAPAAQKRTADAKPDSKSIVAVTPQAAQFIQKHMREGGYTQLRLIVTDEDFRIGSAVEVDAQNDYLDESSGLAFLVDKQSSARLPQGIGVRLTQQDGSPTLAFFSRLVERDPPNASVNLTDARRGFKTKLTKQKSKGRPPAEPPPNTVQLVRFEAPVGRLAAYLSPDPGDGQKHAAMIWLGGGGCSSIDPVWTVDGNYRRPEIVTMIPSLRGGNDNPGFEECYFGEVEDVVAAATFLGQQSYVDPNRIYLAGHSTGGTLSLLVAEYSNLFRATFAYGPTDDVLLYGPKALYFDVTDSKEFQLRAPGRWLHSIRTPTFVFEGADSQAIDALMAMKLANTNSHVQFFNVTGADHFSVVGLQQLVVQKILRDTGPTCTIEFSPEEIRSRFNE